MRQLPAVRTCWRSNRQERRRCDGTWDTCGPPTPGAPSLYLRGGDRSAALSRPAPGLRTRGAARPALGSESLKAEPPAAALLCSAPLLGNGGRACELNSSTDRQGSPSRHFLFAGPVMRHGSAVQADTKDVYTPRQGEQPGSPALLTQHPVDAATGLSRRLSRLQSLLAGPRHSCLFRKDL